MTRILIVDELEIMRQALRLMLEARPNFHVIGECGDGRDALDQAMALKPDIVILEHSLPQLNGRDLTIELLKALPSTEVLMYTAIDRDDVIEDALRSGVRGLVLKTDPADQLFSAVDSLARHRPYFSPTIAEAFLTRIRSQKRESGEPLSLRERQVVQLIAEGRANKQIAYVLNVSIKTIESHRANVMTKLQLRNTADLVRYAVRSLLVAA